MNITKERLVELKEKFKNQKIAVIGDLMLDSYFWGDVKRISPEAPVPVVEIENEFFRFGGAANVALNIAKLNATPIPIGVIGNDINGKRLKDLMDEAGLNFNTVVIDESRPTTSKTRVIANNQHVVRIDKESKKDISPEIEKKLLDILEKNVESIDAIILQDYNKGVLTKNLIYNVIELANKNNLKITVDPKFNNFFNYKNVTVFKPNKKETEDAFGRKLTTQEELEATGKELLEKINAEYVLLTLGSDGVALFTKNDSVQRIPTKARKVADVSGAGDTVISTLTVALSAGANILEAAYLANFAGGLVCEEIGIVPIDPEHLFNEVIRELKL